MKQKLDFILSMAAWDFRLARKPYFILCAAFAVQQLCVVLAVAAFSGDVGTGLAYYYNNGLQSVAFGLTFLAAVALSARCFFPGGKTRAGYTWLTIPQPPAVKLAAQVLAGMVMGLGVLAWQMIVYFIAFWPVTVLENAVAQQRLQTAGLPAQILFEQFTLNGTLRYFLPHNLQMLPIIILVLFAAALLLPAVFLHKGWRRIPAAVICAVGGWMSLQVLVYAEGGLLNLNVIQHSAEILRAAAILLAILIVSWLWELWAIAKAEPV